MKQFSRNENGRGLERLLGPDSSTRTPAIMQGIGSGRTHDVAFTHHMR